MLKTKISLKNFFIFNSSFCSREGSEEDKILFFYPEIEVNEKLKDVGFIEALAKFTGTFSFEETTPKDVLTMRTTKAMKFFFEPEKNFWIVLTVNVPFERKEKDKKEYIEYYSDDAHDAIYKKVIQRSYFHFRLFHNTFESNMIGDTPDEKLTALRSKFENFFTKYLSTWNIQNADIIDAIESLQYKPITHLVFFRIAHFLNVLMSMRNLQIKKSIFYYNQEIVYSSINPSTLYIIHEHLSDSLFPKFLQRRNNQSFDNERSTGSFVTELETDTLQNAPKVYIQHDSIRNETKAYRLVAFNILDVTLVMFVEDTEDTLTDEFSNEMKFTIGPQLGLLSKELTENSLHFQQNAKADETVQEKYIYFNHRNHRFHACFYDKDTSSSHREGRKTKLSTSVMNLLCDLYAKDEQEHKRELIDSEKEVIVKTFNDYWICCRSYNNRSLYLILHKSSTLIDIAEESQKLLAEIVKNVYFSTT